MKKAQITMFIILGLVILSVFAFVFFASGQIVRQQAQQQAETIAAQILETTSLKFYVNLCTEKALEKGIDLLSKQGGKILPGQKGSLLRYPEKSFLYTEKDNSYNVIYGIAKENVLLPQYPCKIGFDNYDVPPAFCAYRADDSKFNNMMIGINNLPRLCKDRYGGCSLKEGWDSRFSVQSQLESFVANYTKECVDFESIVGVNQTYLVKEGNVTSNITFSDTAVTAVVNFPLVIAPIGSQPVIKLLSFQSTTPSRFKVAYGIARSLAANDTSSPSSKSFDIKKGFKSLINQIFGVSKESGFAFEKRENVTMYDDFIRIIDRISESGLVVQFLRENRPPVLEYINPAGLHEKTSTRCDAFDVLVMQGKTLQLNPTAFDADEDDYKYEYKGWLENYNETISNPIKNDAGCVASFTGIIDSYTKNSQKRWIKDINFEKNGIASALMTEKDIGPHNLTIKICDSQYCDFEVIRILVDDLIKVTIGKANQYANQILSIEDPYTFTAKIDDIYNPGDYAFSWVISSGTTEVFRSPGLQDLKIPTDSYTVLNIKTVTPFKTPTTYKVKGEVIQGGTDTAGNEIEIKAEACVPYKTKNPPYPYSGTSDPFLGNHTCCFQDATGAISINQGATCYQANTWGIYNSFDENKFKTTYDSLPTASKVGAREPTSLPKTYVGFASELGASPILKIKTDLQNSKITYDNTNDIFKRTFTRKCDGTRGNVCVGDYAEIYTAIPCDNKQPGESAFCSGPPTEFFDTDAKETSSPRACVNYQDTTFEQLAKIRTDPACNSAPKCTALNSGNFVSSSTGHYICNATCYSGDCSKILPSLCADCYKKQKCETTTVNGIPSVRLTEFDNCNSLACITKQRTLSNVCHEVSSPHGTIPILVSYSCKSEAEVQSSKDIFNLQQKNCRTFEQKAADDYDDGDYPDNYPGHCTQYYDFGTCAPTGCVSGNFVFQEEQKEKTTGNFVYIEYTAENLLCVSHEHDYDLLGESMCEGKSFGSKIGHWSDTATLNKCCGDDAVDVWNPATNTCGP